MDSPAPRSEAAPAEGGRTHALRALGTSPPNQRWARLLTGRGRFVANLEPGRRCLHAALVRSPEAHGVLEAVDIAPALALPGVEAVLIAADLDGVCAPWRAEHALFEGARIPAERPLAAGRVRYVGEPVALVLADDPGVARDAAERVALTISALPAYTDPVSALSADAEPIHPDLTAKPGEPANLHHAFAGESAAAPPAARTVEIELALSRVAPQAMETRAVLADYDAAEGTLTVHQSHQHPHMMQDVFARLLALPEHKVRVVCPDVGGAFGGKQQLHPDEMAVVAAAVRLGRRVRYVASRGESLMVDAQARDHVLRARAGLDGEGRIVSLALDDVCGIGAVPHFPRTSFAEAAHAAKLFGAPYDVAAVATRSQLAFQNRPHLGHFRGVGHPIACLATERLMDAAARAVGEDPIAFRRRHLRAPGAGPVTTAGGLRIEDERTAECLDAVDAALGGATRGADGSHLRGLGVACLVEMSASGPKYYGEGGVHITCDETAIVRMEPSGRVRVATGNTDQGQGADQALAQIVADVLSLSPDDVAVFSGDSASAPYGGGAFGSRGTVQGGAAAHDGAQRLRDRLLEAAGLLTQRRPSTLALEGGAVVGPDGPVMGLAEIAGACQFRPHLFPEGFDTGLTAVGRHTPRADAIVSSAAFGATVSVDRGTGAVSVERLVVAHDAGTMVSPEAVRGQLQGAMAQGLGQALLEAVRLDGAGQPLTGSYMDYAMPRADDVPSVEIIHLPSRAPSAFAPRGVGEAGTSGAPAAILCALDDALAAVGARIAALPATPAAVWQALRDADGSA